MNTGDFVTRDDGTLPKRPASHDSPFSMPKLACRSCGSGDADHVYCSRWIERIRKAMRRG